MTDARGRFITFEGGEGAGKSTQVARLVAALDADGIEVVATREPGGSPGGEAIRTLLVTGEVGRWDPVSEAFLHVAARRDHVVSSIEPALRRGAWVVCDRFADSTVAYQGFGLGVARETLATLHCIAVGSLIPDLTVVLDLPVDVGLARAAHRKGAAQRYERMERGFHERLRQGFLEIARAAPERCVVLDADRPADVVFGEVLALVRARLAR